jgi:uncharacterized damage-inducible protein DinB
MNAASLSKLYAHMDWADAFVWRAVFTHEPSSRDDFIVETLVHLHMVQFAWLAIWRGDEVAMTTGDDFDGLVAIREWGRSYHLEVARFLDGLTDERLKAEIEVPWMDFIEKEIGRPPAPARLGDSVYQVAAHSIHHRAQVNRRIRELGGEPGMVDYIGWVWRGKPGADWSV